MRILLLTAVLGLLSIAPASAQMTLQDAQDEADAWVLARWDAIRDRVVTCLGEPGGPEKCHTAWAATISSMCNNTVALSQLCSVTLDDPGVVTTDECAQECATGRQSFSGAGINIPATGPLNATVNIALAPGGGRGEQLIVAFTYDGEMWTKGYGDLILPGFDWRVAAP